MLYLLMIFFFIIIESCRIVIEVVDKHYSMNILLYLNILLYYICDLNMKQWCIHDKN